MLFGSPEYCSKCKIRDLHACKWRITYENVFITWEVEKTKFPYQDIFTFAKNKNEEVEHIIGSIRMSLGKGFHMEQYFCDKCYSTLQLNRLPEEWGYNCYFLEKGWEHISLP